jgi:hypothetical protein
MHSLRSSGYSFPLTTFGRDYSSSSGSVKLSLNLSLSDITCPSSLRAPYLSPPMSGSPSPGNHTDPLHAGRRRRRSSSSPATARQAAAEPVTSYGDHPVRGTGPELLISNTQPPTATHANIPPAGLAPAIEGTHLRPALVAATPLPPRATQLPPRSTRRAKAHVASACVNCKRKHLGCDSARPCRRCVVAGKQVVCPIFSPKQGYVPYSIPEFAATD